MNHNITPEERAGMEAAQRNMAEFAAKDAELDTAVIRERIRMSYV